jgi:hypothetical protein
MVEATCSSPFDPFHNAHLPFHVLFDFVLATLQKKTAARQWSSGDGERRLVRSTGEEVTGETAKYAAYADGNIWQGRALARKLSG